jgi:hypothetical protein
VGIYPFFDQAAAPLIERLNAANAEASTRVAHLEATTAQAYNPPNPTYATCMRHQEIRALFRTIPNGDRLRMPEEARKVGDEDTLIAIGSVQP